MAPQRTFTPPVAVDRSYALWLWLEGRVTDFPTSAKHQMGRRILDAAVDVMDHLLRATYASKQSAERVAALAAANQRVALLRLLLRGARERRHLSIDQHEFASGKLAEIGTMVGAWLRSSHGRGGKPPPAPQEPPRAS